MLDQQRPSTQKLSEKNQQNVSKNIPPLISFEPEQEEVIQFNSDYSSQVYDIQYSVISTQTQKKKKQMRQKVNEYLNHRKTLGAVKKPNRMTYMEQEQQIAGDILDQLVLIDQDEKKLDEAQKFILAFNKNPGNAINDYIKQGFIPHDDPNDIAAYLLKSQGLDKQKLGKFFGENNQKTLKILNSYCKLLNFKNIEFDRALRILLSKFRLPGQSQQIQRVVWQFSQSFFEVNQNDYDNPDELFPLAYAIIMLATDAHNPKQQKKMSKQQFVRNTHGACPSITKKYLSNIYDRILSQKFQTQVSDFQNIYARLTDINTSDFQSTLKLTKQLKKGDIFVKVCRNTNKMVQRKIYLSNDQQRIYWKSINDDSEEPRFIQIKDITDLTLGLGSYVMKKNKIPQEFDPMCFTIQTTHRTLDLKAKTNKQRAKWLNYIRAVLIKRRQLRIQFLQNNKKGKYQRQDIEEIWNTQIFPHWDRHWDYVNKKPLVKNVLVRGIQAICCCWKRRPKTTDGFQYQSNSHGLQIKTSKLETLWKMGLPDNSRKVLWPLIIGNNLALNSTMIQQIKKRTKYDHNLRKFNSFDVQAIQMSQICRQFRPDLPVIRQLLVISSIFVKSIPRNQTSNQTVNAGLISFINLLHLGHFLPFYRGEKNEIDLRIQLFEFLLQKNSQKVKRHLEVIKLQTRMYLVSWFLSVFSDCFNHEQAFLYRLWDNFLLQGEIYLFKIGIAIVKYYQVQLKMCTFHQGIKVLRFPKNTSPILFFQILNNQIDVKQEYFNSYIDVRKHAIIKTKVQAIPLE